MAATEVKSYAVRWLSKPRPCVRRTSRTYRRTNPCAAAKGASSDQPAAKVFLQDEARAGPLHMLFFCASSMQLRCGEATKRHSVLMCGLHGYAPVRPPCVTHAARTAVQESYKTQVEAMFDRRGPVYDVDDRCADCVPSFMLPLHA